MGELSDKTAESRPKRTRIELLVRQSDGEGFETREIPSAVAYLHSRPQRIPDADWSCPARYAVLIPGASRPEKFWPEASWQAVGRRLAAQGWTPLVLWGTPLEERMAHALAGGCGGVVPPFLTVAQAASVLAGAAAVVGLDTGFSHLAAALGRPVLGIYCDHEPGLAGLTTDTALRLHPHDFDRLGVESGAVVTVTSASGTATLPVISDPHVGRGAAAVVVHQPGPQVGALVDATETVTEVRVAEA